MDILFGIFLVLSLAFMLFMMLHEGLGDIRESAKASNHVPFEKKYVQDGHYTARYKKLLRRWLVFVVLSIVCGLGCLTCLFLLVQEVNLDYYKQTKDRGEWLLMACIALFFVTGGLVARATVYEGKMAALKQVRDEQQS